MERGITYAAGVLGLALLAAEAGGAATIAAGEERAGVVERFLNADRPRLLSYEAVRTLEASTRGGSMRARVSATTSLDPDRGFQYAIVAEEGSAMIRRRVLRAALDAERTIVAKGEGSRGALNASNYELIVSPEAPTLEEHGLVAITVHPRRHDTMLVEGTVYLSADDADLKRLEGVLVKRPSFWTRRVHIVRHYARLGGVRVPVRMESTANVLIAGTSTFTMTYDYRWINGQSVSGGYPSTDR